MKGKLVHKFNIVSAWHPVVPRGSNLSFCLIALIMYEWKKGHTHLWQTRSPVGLWVTLGRSRRQQSSPVPRHPWEPRRTTTSRRCSRVWSHAGLDGRGHISVRKRWGKSPRHQSDKGEAKKMESCKKPPQTCSTRGASKSSTEHFFYNVGFKIEALKRLND